DAANTNAKKSSEVKDDPKKTELPPTSSSLSVSSCFGDQFLKLSFDSSLVSIVKDTTNSDINSLLEVKIQFEVLHTFPSMLSVPRKMSLILRKIDLSAEALAALNTQVPSVVDNYLGSKVGNQSSTKETLKGKALTKSSKTGKSASAKELVEEPIAEVVMDDVGDVVVLDQPEQPWFNQMVSATKDPLTFNYLIATPINFSKYVLNGLKIENLTQDILLGPAFNLLKGTCFSSPPGHRTVAADYFFNNDLEYLKTSDLEVRKYSKHNVYSTKAILGVKSVSVKKLHGYCHLEDIVVKRSDQQLHKFKEGDFVNLNLNNIEDMLLIVVQHMLFHLDGSVIVNFIVALRMFTRNLILKRRVEDLQLGVESYQKKLNITKPQKTFPEIKFKEPYTPSYDPPGIFYYYLNKQKRVLRADKLYSSRMAHSSLFAMRLITEKRISDKRTKNQAKTDKTEYGMEECEKVKVKVKVNAAKSSRQMEMESLFGRGRWCELDRGVRVVVSTMYELDDVDRERPARGIEMERCNKELEEACIVTMNERCSAVLLNKLPSKEKDPGSFTIPYDIGHLHINNALADLGASISLMPYTVYKKLGLGEPKPTRMSLELADRSIQYPRGITENVLIKIDKFILPIDFVILDMREDSMILDNLRKNIFLATIYDLSGANDRCI
ncbi:putative reverse transcriptase domain-containing protein, partial [Tanacetum coccineum]